MKGLAGLQCTRTKLYQQSGTRRRALLETVSSKAKPKAKKPEKVAPKKC